MTTAIAGDTIVYPVITVNGTPVKVDQGLGLVGVRTERGLNLVGRATLRFATGELDWPALPAALGDDVEISADFVGDGSQQTALVFKGIVTGASYDYDGRVREGVLTVDEPSVKLAIGTTSETYLNMTTADIVAKVVGRTGLAVSCASTSVSFPYVMQSGTDLEFLARLIDRSGLAWWYDGTAEQVVVKDVATLRSGSTAATFRFEDSIIRCSARVSSVGPEQVTVTGWDSAHQQDIAGSPSATTFTSPVFPGASARDSSKSVARDLSPLTAAEATGLADAESVAARSERVIVKVDVVGSPSLEPGDLIAIPHLGKDSDGDEPHLVTEVEHRFRHGGMETRITCGSLRSHGLTDLLGAAPDPAGHVIGTLLPAVVSNAKDPSQLGRVKVKYSAHDDLLESDWARVLSPGGGQGRGFEFTPVVGDEVLLAFELGDTRRPVVLGGLYSERNTLPPSPTKGNVDGNGGVVYRRLTTGADGSVLELGDDPAERYLLLQVGPDKDRLKITTKATELVVKDREIKISNGSGTVTIAANGDITLQAPNVTIKADQKVAIEGGEVAIKASKGKAELNGVQAVVKGATSAEVSATQTAIKGSAAVMIN